MASALPLVDRDDNDIMKSVLFGLNADEKLPGAWKQWRWNGKKLLQPNSELQLFSMKVPCEIEWSTEPFHRSDRQQRNAFSYLLEATLVASRLAKSSFIIGMDVCLRMKTGAQLPRSHRIANFALCTGLTRSPKTRSPLSPRCA
ncbi:hypothetical protein Moror_9488 [Moniliophthora roreri MCA 2997]|uniref:Uncharacterized protein n=1 Tax=Moniliophthora roreri (strain MCA 2997) TaxID=1381753 RepID=V2WGG5_MONRO|nr:hypothetical protein Moror_9488 [Moniliophthora roreri MCA 2997]